MVLYLSALLLGWKAGTVSYLVYLLLGCVGVPVFSGFSGGLQKLAGPTGGYLIGFIALALICGFFAERWQGRRLPYLFGMMLGLAFAYAAGTAWLAAQAGMGFGAALFAGVIPFLPGDAFKIAAILAVGPELRKGLRRAGVLAVAPNPTKL
jgi:biotin transport system substrate-specific component